MGQNKAVKIIDTVIMIIHFGIIAAFIICFVYFLFTGYRF